MDKPVPVIILLGAPGAGKGTQALHLSQKMGICKVSTGDMLRQAVHEDSELGRRVRAIMHDGGLVDDGTMLDVVSERIGRPDCGNGFILDGYPRTRKQAEQLQKILRPDMRLLVFNIQVSEDEIVKRIAGRRTCPECHRVFNVYFRPPSDDEKCDVDGSQLYRRDDDSEEVVRKRIATYKKETLPLIDYYRRKGLLRVINGIQPEETVVQQILDSFRD
jgi:adenylate kinase